MKTGICTLLIGLVLSIGSVADACTASGALDKAIKQRDTVEYDMVRDYVVETLVPHTTWETPEAVEAAIGAVLVESGLFQGKKEAHARMKENNPDIVKGDWWEWYGYFDANGDGIPDRNMGINWGDKDVDITTWDGVDHLMGLDSSYKTIYGDDGNGNVTYTYGTHWIRGGTVRDHAILHGNEIEASGAEDWMNYEPPAWWTGEGGPEPITPVSDHAG
jgi:hypothetical protein